LSIRRDEYTEEISPPVYSCSVVGPLAAGHRDSLSRSSCMCGGSRDCHAASGAPAGVIAVAHRVYQREVRGISFSDNPSTIGCGISTRTKNHHPLVMYKDVRWRCCNQNRRSVRSLCNAE